jgi:hypothetical protein
MPKVQNKPNPLAAFGGGGNQGGPNPLAAFGAAPKKQQGGAGGTPFVPAEAPLPFMALENDKYGLPFYGSGLQGFARKTFAKIFDPSKLLPSPTKEQAQAIEEAAQKGSEIINARTGWDQWLGKWTGVKASEVAQTAVAVNLAAKGTVTDEATGEKKISQDLQFGEATKMVTGTLYRGGGQVISAGLEALSVTDKASRKVQSFNAALDEIGDSSGIIPDATNSGERLTKILGDTPAVRRLGNTLDAINDILPGGFAWNVVRAAIAGGTLAEKWKVVKNNTRASNMIYTMYWDEEKKAEYFRRAKAGENPDLLMRELENPWVELAGSIFGDPATYTGMGVISKFGKAKTPLRFFGKTVVNLPWEVVRLPGFSQILGLKNIGRARLASAGDEFVKIADPGVETAFKALGETADDADALKKIQGAIEAARGSVRKFATQYGFFSPDSSAKTELMKKSVGTVFQVIAGRFRNPDDMLDTFRAFRNLGSADNQKAAEAFSTLKELYGTVPFSHAGMQSMEFFNRLVDDVDIPALVSKYGDDIPAFVEEVTGKLNGVVDDMYPSVNDMQKAWKEAKTLGKTASERQKFLAKSYDDLVKTKPTAIWANNVNNSLTGNKAYRGLQSFYANVLMGMRPAYAMRNLQSNSFHIWHDLGSAAGREAVETGLEAMVKSTAGRVLKKNWVDDVVGRNVNKIKEILGSVPTETIKGVGSGEGGALFLGVGQDIEKVHSSLIVRHVVEKEMEKALRYGGIPSVSALEKLGLPPEMSGRLYTHALENWGDAKKTLAAFRKEMATGFAETWRSLELDPEFKDLLQKSNLLDELETIRKTAPDAATFSEQMDAFVKKIDDLAQRTADEPALVSADNPASDIVVTIEKAFDEGGRKIMSEEELNQFRALNELRYQAQSAFRDVAQALRGQLTGMLDVNTAKQFDQRFADTYKILDEGSSHWRRYADEVYNGAYAQSKKGVPVNELWGKVRTVVLDTDNAGKPVLKKISLADAFPSADPATMTQSEFQGHLWKWFKEQQSQFWSRYTQDYLVRQNGILDEMAAAAGTTLDEVKLGYYQSLNNPQLTQIDTLMKQIQDWESHMDYGSFSKLDMKGKKLSDMTQIAKDFPNFQGGKSRLFNAVNADRAAKGLDSYATIDDVPFEEAVQALKKRAKPIPPYVEGTQPTVTRQLLENMNGGLRDVINDFKNGTLEKWGQKVPIDTSLTDEMETGLSKWANELDRRTVSNRAAAAAIANETRNFILHDYNKTYADKFASYFLMYHYWGSRTYGRWAERVVDTPGVAAAYSKWRASMEKINSDQPEFYRYNMQVKLPGMETTPFYFNLESTLNPLYSLTGVDFNDSNRRADWLSSAVDDMGKFGFNTAIPLQWAMAFRLMQKGEAEAGRRWLGRAIPATQDLKAALNLMNAKTGIDLMPDLGKAYPGAKYGEFDPFVNMTSGGSGIDAYEERRVGRALSSMIQEGLSPEAANDALYNKQGPLYDEAVFRAINERAPAQVASYFMGVGYKARTEGDMQVDEFYTQYYKLLSMRENMSPDDYQAQLNELMAPDGDYPFAQTVLLAQRGGDDRDAAYMYNVLGRLPPGDAYKILADIGVDADLVNRFYQDKGDFSGWTTQDKNRLISAGLDLGATFALPDGATRQEWNDAKGAYKDIREAISGEYGEEVWNTLSTYYDLMDTNKDKASEFKLDHPEITQALQLKREMIMSDPLVYKYYGSFDTIEAYFDGKMRAYLADKYGSDITDKQTEYFNLKVESPQKARAFLNQNPELKAYWKEKGEMEEPYSRAMVDFAKDLPEQEPAKLREDFNPANATQEELAAFTQKPSVSWDEMQGWMSAPLVTRVQDYWETGEPLSPAAQSELEYVASKYGYYNSDSLLRDAGLAMYKGQGRPNPLKAFGLP